MGTSVWVYFRTGISFPLWEVLSQNHVYQHYGRGESRQHANVEREQALSIQVEEVALYVIQKTLRSKQCLEKVSLAWWTPFKSYILLTLFSKKQLYWTVCRIALWQGIEYFPEFAFLPAKEGCIYFLLALVLFFGYAWLSPKPNFMFLCYFKMIVLPLTCTHLPG